MTAAFTTNSNGNEHQAAPAVSKPIKSRVANEALADVLDRQTAAGVLFRTEGDRIRCVACGHRCLIAPAHRGICKVRYNEGGQLRVPFGYVSGLQCDPVEKKPFFHVYPGADALTFGMMGCDFHCSYCQNWMTSQALRDAASSVPIRTISADRLVRIGRQQGARLVVSSYNEPLITAEWSVSVFQKAKSEGFLCAFVSNGNATAEALDFVQPWIVAYKVDLKSFNDKNYRSLGGTLEHVTETIRMVHDRGIWLEVVTLLVPGFNDSDDEIRSLCRFLVSVSPDIPWHVTAFHKDYRMTDPDNTSSSQLVHAAEIGTDAGLHFVYAGNRPGEVGQWENTRCPNCQHTLIERFGYLVQAYTLTPQGTCPRCQHPIPGVWPRDGHLGVKTGEGISDFYRRLPRAVSL